MSNGSLKKALKEASEEKQYTLDAQEFNYIRNLENVKHAVIGAVELYIQQAELGFLQYLGSHKFGLDMNKRYKFDLDIEEDSDKIVRVSEDN